MYEKELKISKQAAKQAGLFLKKEFFKWKKKNTQYKLHNEIVTWCDAQSEQIIFKLIKKHFPSYAILSEESGKQDKPSDYTWIIDPLDGTTNFTIHHPVFAVSIALAYKKEIVMGVTYNPLLDEIYYATKNGGAFKNGKKIKVSKKKDLKKAIITYCHGQGPINTKKAYKLYQHFHGNYRHCYHWGSTTLETAMVANGKTELHIVSGSKVWDVAAGSILIKEAGGIVTDWHNKKWNITSTSLIAANKTIHKIGLKELKKMRLA